MSAIPPVVPAHDHDDVQQLVREKLGADGRLRVSIRHSAHRVLEWRARLERLYPGRIDTWDDFYVVLGQHLDLPQDVDRLAVVKEHLQPLKERFEDLDEPEVAAAVQMFEEVLCMVLEGRIAPASRITAALLEVEEGL